MNTAKRYHFDLSHLDDGIPELTFHVGSHQYAMQRHTPETRAAAIRDNRALALIPSTHHDRITHFVDVDPEHLPTDRLCLMRVTYDHGKDRLDLPALVHAAYYIPEKHRLAHRRDKYEKGRPHLPHKLSAYGVDVSALTPPHTDVETNQSTKPKFLKSAVPVLKATAPNAVGAAHGGTGGTGAHQVSLVSEHLDQFHTPLDAAGFILFHHPSLSSGNPRTAATIYDDHINSPQNQEGLSELALAIRSGGRTGWATSKQDTMPDGTPMTYEYEFGSHQPGDPVMHYELNANVVAALPAALKTPLKTSHDDLSLQNKTWSVTQGATALHGHGPVPGAPPLLKAGAGKAKWTLKQKNADHGLSVDESSLSFTANSQNDGSGTFEIDATNKFLRTLGAYVEFYDEAGNAIENPEGWESNLPSGLSGLETSSKKYISTVNAVCTIMGIPLPADATTLSFPWPSNAASATLMFGGLGGDLGNDVVCIPGTTLTSIFQYGIPMMMLAVSVGLRNNKPLQDFMAEPKNVIAVLGIGATIAIAVAEKTDVGYKRTFSAYGSAVAGLMLKAALKPVFERLLKTEVEQEAEHQIPFVGWALLAVDVAVTLAQLAETTMEVASSPCVLRYDVKRAFDLKVTINPDPAHGEPGRPETAVWPAVSDNYEVTVQYQGGTNFVKKGNMPETTSNKPISLTFNDLAVGGKIQIMAAIYSESGWLCGKWTSDWMDAVPDQGSSTKNVPPASIVEQLVPLTTDSQYTHKEKIVYDASQSKHIWQVGTPSMSTAADLNSGNQGPALSRLVDLTIFERTFEIGYAWQAASQGLPLTGETSINSGQAYAFRNLSVLADPESRLKFPNRSFIAQTFIVYDQFGQPTDPGSGSKPHQFFIDPRNGQFHLRQLVLDGGNSMVDLTQPLQSWGQFSLNHIDAIVVSSGKVVAASWEDHKLAILELPDAPSADAQAKQAINVSGEGTRQGLVKGPMAMCVTPDGRVLALETLNQRVQAFDLSANPVPSFDGAKLFTVSASDFAADMDRSVFSAAFQAQFTSNRVNHLFDVDAALVSDLNQSNLSENLRDAFSLKGVDLDYDDADATLTTSIKTVSPGQWQLDCVATKRQYLIFTAPNGTLEVYVTLTNVIVEVRSPEQRWIVKDKNGSVSYDVRASQTQAGMLDVFEFLSYMPLYNPTPDRTAHYLDIASEARGYVYVLSYTGDGSQTTDYFLDIYEPNGAFLCRTPDSRYSTNPQNVAAARLVVDTWRNAYTLNFEAQTGPNGSTEPSIGHWMPMPPLFSLDLSNQAAFDGADIGAVRSVFAQQHVPITLGDGATITTVSSAGHWKVTDGTTVYDVIRSGDGLDVYMLASGATI